MTREAKKTVGYYLMLRTVSAFGISLIAATYVTFLIGKGLNLFQVNLVNVVFYGTLFVFEVPTAGVRRCFRQEAVVRVVVFSFRRGHVHLRGRALVLGIRSRGGGLRGGRDLRKRGVSSMACGSGAASRLMMVRSEKCLRENSRSGTAWESSRPCSAPMRPSGTVHFPGSVAVACSSLPVRSR